MTTSTSKERNREQFPETAKIVDEYRDVFGPDVKLKWAIENGKTLGKVPDGQNKP